jgi:hypothetical protein
MESILPILPMRPDLSKTLLPLLIAGVISKWGICDFGEESTSVVIR